MNSQNTKIRFRSIRRDKISWRLIKKIFIIVGRRERDFTPLNLITLNQIVNSSIIKDVYIGETNIGIRLISLLKYSDIKVHKETMISILKDLNQTDVFLTMISEHFTKCIKENANEMKEVNTFPTLMNLKNSEKWRVKNIISQ